MASVASTPFPGAVRIARSALLALALSGAATGGALAQPAKALVPVPSATLALMAARDMDPRAPILIRAYKKESEMEVWKQTRSGRYALLKTFPICRWSGQLGPKRKTGDRQTPEGFYAVSAGQMNPNSSYHLSFDVGYPNAYDRAHGGTGSYLMTHGTCSSMGCFAMTDVQVSEIYGLARDALAAGQRAFQFQAFPFRMTAANMARARSEGHIDFWRQLKEGSDRFEATGEELAVSVTGGRYGFGPSRNAAREAAALARIEDEKGKTARLVEDGAAAVRITYADGGMHASFASLSGRGGNVGAISRPEALAFAGREIVLIPARRKAPPPVLVATAAPAAAPAANEARLSPVLPPLGTATAGIGALFAPVPLLPGLPAAGAPMMAGSTSIMSAALQRRPVDKVAMRGA